MTPQSHSKLAPWDLHSSPSFMAFLRNSGLLVPVWIESLAAAAPSAFCSVSRMHRKNFAMTSVIPWSCVEISNTVVSGIPRSAFSSYTVSCQSFWLQPYLFNILTSSACGRPPRMWITFNRFLTIFEVFVQQFYLYCTHCIFPEAFWIIQRVSMEECLRLVKNLIQIHCSPCSVILSAAAIQHTCSVRGVYYPSLTSTVKLSFFTHAHSSPLSLAARWHRCRANRSCYINNGWTFSRSHMCYLTLCYSSWMFCSFLSFTFVFPCHFFLCNWITLSPK